MVATQMTDILVLYYSRHGTTKHLANAIASGIESLGCKAVLRTVPQVSDNLEKSQAKVPIDGDPYVSKHDLANCAALALGSPTHFGNMPASMKHFWDSTTDLWLKGALVDKPACVFSSSSSMHGGQESTLISMMLPLFHHGMCVIGLPYTEPALHDTVSGGTPYGVTHVSNNNRTQLTDDEIALAKAMGKRIAQWAVRSQT